VGAVAVLYFSLKADSVFGRLLFVEISPEEHQLLSYFGLSKEVLPQVLRTRHICVVF
jgi:hypothetical protein